jgi:hypothetical protein
MPWRTLALLLAGQLMASMDSSILTVAMPALQRELDVSPTMLQAIFAGYTFAFGVCAGQVAGGVIVTGAGWRWALLINVPIGLVLLALAPRLRPPGVRRGARLDLPGVIELTEAMALILVPLLLGREQGWPAWVWPSLALGLGGVAVFARLERRRSSPLLDPVVLREPGVSAGLTTVVVVMGAYAAPLFSLTLHMQDDLGFSALRAGLAFAAYAVGFAAMSLTWRRLPPLPWPVVGPLALGGAALVIAIVAGSTWPPVAEPVLVIAGAGHAAGYGPVAARTVARVKSHHAPEASALLTTGSVLASSFAVATLGSLYLASGLTAVAAGIAAMCAIAALTSTTSP